MDVTMNVTKNRQGAKTAKVAKGFVHLSVFLAYLGGLGVLAVPIPERMGQ